MKSSKQICESDSKGLVHVDVSVGLPGHQFEVVVAWDEVEADLTGLPVDDLLGILAGADLERPPQGAYERRDPID